MKKTILITGVAGNLGSAVKEKLIANNYHIVGTVLSEKDVQDLQSDVLDAVALDLTHEDEVRQFVKEAKEKWHFVGVVLLAGGFSSGDLLTTSKAAIQKMVALNFETAFYLVRELLPVFEERGGGQFILTGTRGALDPNSGINATAYALSKGLIFQLAELINAYGKDKNIDATVIVPSTIDTARNREEMPNADFSKWVSPEAIADIIQFVFSDSGRQMRQSVIKMYNEA